MPYCRYCGAQINEDSKFCLRCGQPVPPIVRAAHPEEKRLQAPLATGGQLTPASAVVEQAKEKEMAESSSALEERYLGGFVSGRLKPKGRGIDSRIGGCGLYATSSRIIVVKSKKGYSELAVFGGLVGITAAAVAGRTDSAARTIAELEEKKDFEVRKEDISAIEVRKPHGLTVGSLKIALNSGESIDFGITAKKEFENSRDLMKVFYPERLKVEE